MIEVSLYEDHGQGKSVRILLTTSGTPGDLAGLLFVPLLLTNRSEDDYVADSHDCIGVVRPDHFAARLFAVSRYPQT